jgi:hypothetical protein
LNKVPGVSAGRDWPNEAGQPLAWSLVTFDPAVTGLNRDEIMDQLMKGDPAIAVSRGGDDGIHLNPMTLQPGEAAIVLKRLLAILGTAG